jgi:hypothetical protein
MLSKAHREGREMKNKHIGYESRHCESAVEHAEKRPSIFPSVTFDE